MAGERSSAELVDNYIARFPPETQKLLDEMRALVRATAPDATETISYAIPTFDLEGKHLVHFAGFKNHVGFYPTPSGTKEFADELSAYETGRGSVRFRLDEAMPTDLIRRMVEFRVEEVKGETGGD
jgi:uncharacterized protein YdhG (YjbR/CyaY superfamily)